MKMLNNVLGADVFAISHTPIQSPQSTKMGEGDLRCVARPPEPPAQVHQDHHAEDGAVAEHADGAEHADEVDAREQKKRYKNSVLPPTVLVPCVAVVETRWPLGANANAPRLDGGCWGRSACRDSQSRLWDHQSHRGSSNQACHQNWRKTSTRSGLRQTKTLCGGIV